MDCLVCNSKMTNPIDWFYVCRSCGFERSTLEPGAGRGIDGLETLRRQNFSTLIERISSHLSIEGKTCLEVGCAEGWFLEAIGKEGARLLALEPSDLAHDLEARGFETIKGFFPNDLPVGGTYDLIVFNDVFEHIADPVSAIKACDRHLNAGGMAVINLPSSLGFFYRISKFMQRVGMSGPFERMWQVGFPSPHVSYFSPGTLQTLVEQNSGLKKVDGFTLPSIVRTGLKERVSASYRGFVGSIVYLSILCAIPVIRLLPQDICVLFFRKESDNSRLATGDPQLTVGE